MKRPILYGLAFLISGILMGSYADARMALFFALGLGFICFCMYKIYRYKPIFIFLLFALLGFWRTGHSMREPEISPGAVRLTGMVRETGFTASGNQRLVVDTDALRIMAYLKPGMNAEIGQEIILTGQIRPLEKPRFPGAYNEWQTLRARKIDAKIFPDAMETGAVYRTNRYILNAVSNRLAAVYDAVLPAREAAVIRSVILGDRAGLDDDIADLYRMAGIYHILAISGLHIAILMLAVKRVFEMIMAERQAAVAAVAVMIFYCLLTGAAVSTVRALTMCGVGIGAKLLFREYDLLASTAFACIVLLLYEPLYLYSAGFQLSFAAVSGIALLTPSIETALTQLRFPFPKAKNTLAAGIAAVLATYPVLSFHFYEISTYSILANLVIAPTVVALVIMGAAVGLAGLIWLPGAVFLSGVLFYLLRLYEMACRFFVALPFSVIQTGSCGLAVVVAAYGVMVLAAARAKKIYVAAGVVALAVCIGLRAYPPGWDIMVMDEVSVLRHRREAWVIGDADTYDASRYLRYLGLTPSRYISGEIVITMGTGAVGFYSEAPADVRVVRGEGDISVHTAQIFIINSGERTAAMERLQAQGVTAYDTRDGAVRVYGDGKGIRVFTR